MTVPLDGEMSTISKLEVGFLANLIVVEALYHESFYGSESTLRTYTVKVRSWSTCVPYLTKDL